ncbi:hypothetical protein [Sulfurimonas sp. C5]|uniref:hypothetical protein n=1 Tax=Sulfurimonas sp. C5 TaxID=3036947 RepID=UPI002457A54D|nr:hypothetical protein [Sulfurimonas sp. C5]MDH4945107.1 hypothetical protein [Sulfurimonas sp. C5]
MYYNTPNIHRYLDFIVKFRKFIILFFIFLATLSATLFQPKFLSSDELFWLNSSKELQKTESKNFTTYIQSKLIVKIETLNDETLSLLQKLHTDLSSLKNVKKVSSIFSNDFIENRYDSNSSNMLVVLNGTEVDTFKLKQLLKSAHNDYCNVVDKEFSTFYFYISATEKLDISGLKIPGKYQYIDSVDEIKWSILFIYAFIFASVLLLLFRVLFRNYIAAFIAMFVITLSTVLTFTTIIMLTGIHTIHITMPFITISIALVEFLYFYYRWHVSQYKTNVFHSLRKMLNRSMIPAMWTSVLTILGLGSLVLIDSDIIKLLSLSVIVSSVMSYILNLTLLPALLSYFTLKHTHVPYAKLGFMLSSNELHYNRKFLYTFLSITYLLLLVGGFLIYSKSHNFFELHVQNEQIELKIPYEQIDLNLINSLDQFSQDIQEKFEDGLGDVVSVVTLIKNLNEANTQTDTLDEEALLQALFYIDLYKLNDKYFDDNSVNLVINIFDINKLELLDWLVNYKGINLYFLDQDSLLSIAKYNQTILLATSLFAALFLIGLVTGWIFRLKTMIFVGFSVNLIPILWFGVLITVFDIPLSLEMLIAMTISLGLASDATIHFAFKYFRLRYFGHSQKHALEKVFFYAGIPVIIGSIVLITIFGSLYFSQVQSLQLIGLYSALLITLSLLSDLFILPVMLLFVDKYHQLKQAR